MRNLRVSVTDRCNLRCSYCMPEEEYSWLPKGDILSFEEIARLVDAFTHSGVRKLRLTGGEPLMRRDLPALVELFASNDRLEDLALTTNGLLLGKLAEDLHLAGLHRVTVSLDSLDRTRFHEITRFDRLSEVLSGLERAHEVGFRGTKIDTVVMRDVNDDELVDLIEYGKFAGVEVRFIEYMDVGGATQWSADTVVPREEMLARLAIRYGDIRPVNERTSAPADRFRLPDGTTFGIISSTTEPFCDSCDRSRLTADGTWYHCLYAHSGYDLRSPLRQGATADDVAELLQKRWEKRDDRGAEERLANVDRSALHHRDLLTGDPRLEMHTRGG
jgi:GTP 3',8-cyclase